MANGCRPFGAWSPALGSIASPVFSKATGDGSKLPKRRRQQANFAKASSAKANEFHKWAGGPRFGYHAEARSEGSKLPDLRRWQANFAKASLAKATALQSGSET